MDRGPFCANAAELVPAGSGRADADKPLGRPVGLGELMAGSLAQVGAVQSIPVSILREG